jgi:Zn-dependent protease/CBS domain-containing protein
MGIVGGLLFFASVLLHELGHALSARREGIDVDGITLWLFGGVASFRGDYPGPWAEFRVAVAGPAVSLAIGVAGVAAGALLPLPEAVDAVVTWLGYTNLFLLAFNLLPAAPLDGGRILRAVLWAVRGDRTWATKISTGAGRGFGALMAGAGIALVLATGALDGLWLAVLGWFLAGSATSEARQQQALHALSGMRVADVMVPNPITVDGGMSIGEFVDSVVGQRHFSTYPVVQDGRVSGLLPFRRLATVPRDQWDSVTLAERMVPLAEVPVVNEQDDLADAIREVASGELKRALVTDGSLITGLLSITDVAEVIDRALARDRRQ